MLLTLQLKKKCRLANYSKKQNPSISCMPEHVIDKDTHRLKVKVWKMIYQENGSQKAKIT
jgi:hypothetical protein